MIGARASDSIFAFFVAQVVNLPAFLCRPYRVSCYFVVIVFLIDKVGHEITSKSAARWLHFKSRKLTTRATSWPQA